MADPVQRTVAEHLREIRRTEVPPVGWHLNGNHRTASGLVLPAPWLAQEFPEFAQDPLPPFLEACRETGEGTRWTEGDKARRRRSWTQRFFGHLLSLLFFGFIANLLYMAIVGRGPVVPHSYFIVAALVTVALLFITAKRKRGISIPQNPSQMLFHRSREFQQDFRVIPLTARDLYLGEGTCAMARDALPSHWRASIAPLVAYYAVFLVLAYIAGRSSPGGWIPPLVLAATLDFLLQYKRGCSSFMVWGAGEIGAIHQIRMLAFAKRVRRAFPGCRCSWRKLGRRLAREWHRTIRALRKGRLMVAMFIWDLPALLVMAGGVAMGATALVNPRVWWMSLVAAAILFTLARSPLVSHGHKGSCYRARILLTLYTFYLGYLRRSQQREEGGYK